MAATTEVAGEKVEEARKRLAAALDRGREIYGLVRDKEAEGARAADGAVRDHPYEAIAIGIVAGAFIGYLFARACSQHSRENHDSRR